MEFGLEPTDAGYAYWLKTKYDVTAEEFLTDDDLEENIRKNQEKFQKKIQKNWKKKKNQVKNIKKRKQ